MSATSSASDLPRPVRLGALTIGAQITGIDSRGPVRVIQAQWHGADCLDLTYRDATGRTDSRLLYRDDETRHSQGMLSVHTSLVEPLPHQIIAVYEELLPIQPLRFLLADDPGAGKTSWTTPPKTLLATDWDLVVVDEAHKMSATFFGGEVKMTQRHRLGHLLGGIARHFLLLTATPHNGKEEDFQLFMSLLDADRFEGRFRDGVHVVDVSDLMHRKVKEDLLKFDGTPLFPERRAYTVSYELSDPVAALYHFKKIQRRGAQLAAARTLTDQELEDLDNAPDAEVEALEDEVVDQAIASRTIEELEAEIATLKRLVGLAEGVLESGEDTKWNKLSELLQDNPEMYDEHGRRRKLVLFTEHRDTLAYLARRIRTLLGRDEAVITIAGGMLREERRKAQESFTQGRDVQILVATDAAGEGINLQRFSERIQTESDRLEGKVFDVLDRVFEGAPLRKLLIDAIRYGDSEEAKLRLTTQMDELLDLEHVQALWDRRALARDAMDASQIERIREAMERAETRRLQPHYIEAFFLEAFQLLGGTVRQREPRRYEVTHVPATLRNRARLISTGTPLLRSYERITFEKTLIHAEGKALGPHRASHRGQSPRAGRRLLARLAPPSTSSGRTSTKSAPTSRSACTRPVWPSTSAPRACLART